MRQMVIAFALSALAFGAHADTVKQISLIENDGIWGDYSVRSMEGSPETETINAGNVDIDETESIPPTGTERFKARVLDNSSQTPKGAKFSLRDKGTQSNGPCTIGGASPCVFNSQNNDAIVLEFNVPKTSSGNLKNFWVQIVKDLTSGTSNVATISLANATIETSTTWGSSATCDIAGPEGTEPNGPPTIWDPNDTDANKFSVSTSECQFATNKESEPEVVRLSIKAPEGGEHAIELEVENNGTAISKAAITVEVCASTSTGTCDGFGL